MGVKLVRSTEGRVVIESTSRTSSPDAASLFAPISPASPPLEAGDIILSVHGLEPWGSGCGDVVWSKLIRFLKDRVTDVQVVVLKSGGLSNESPPPQPIPPQSQSTSASPPPPTPPSPLSPQDAEAKEIGGYVFYPLTPTQNLAISPYKTTEEFQSACTKRTLVKHGAASIPVDKAKTNFIDKFLDNPESTPVYLVLFSNPDVLLIMRRPHNKQELVHYIPPESSPLNVSRIWLVQQSLHLQTLQLSLPSSQTQTFTLTSPLSSIHITPSLSQSVSSVLNRSSDSSTSSLTWSELLSSGIFNSHSLPNYQTPTHESVTLSQSKSLPGLTAHQLVSGTPFSDAVKRKTSNAPFSLLKATEYDQFNLTPLHYSVLSSNKAFFTEALVQNPAITTTFIIDDKNGISILDVIALRGEWLFLEVLMNWQGFQLTKCFSAKVRNPIKTALLTSDVPAPKVSRFVRTAYEGGFTVDYSITKDLIWKESFSQAKIALNTLTYIENPSLPDDACSSPPIVQTLLHLKHVIEHGKWGEWDDWEEEDDDDSDWEDLGEKCPPPGNDANPYLKFIAFLIEKGFDPNYVSPAANQATPAISILSQIAKLVGDMNERLAKGQQAHPLNADLDSRDIEEMRSVVLSLSNLLFSSGARLNHPSNPSHFASDTNINLLGTAERIHDSIQAWNKHENVECFMAGVVKVNDKEKSTIKSPPMCSICRAKFGLISTRKHLCNVSKAWVCDDCSQKRVIIDGEEVRVSNGMYVVVMEHGKRVLERKERERKQREKRVLREMEEEESARRNAAASRRVSSQADENANRTELFGKHRQSIIAAVKGVGDFFNGEERDSTSKGDVSSSTRKVEGAAAAAAEARDRLNERGEKLSQLSEKTEALANQSSEFARLARELNQQQKRNSLFFG